MLERHRAIQGFHRQTFTRMLTNLVRAHWSDFCGWLSKDGPKMVSWVLGYCVDADGRLLVAKTPLTDLKSAAERASRNMTAGSIGEFLD